MRSDPPPAPPSLVAGADDLERLRRWAFATLADGAGLEAIDVVDRVAADSSCEGALFELASEVRVRVGIALDDAELVQEGLAPPPSWEDPDDDHEPEVSAMLARSIGAQWMVETIERERGRSARFTEGRTWLAVARWGLARTLVLPDLDAAQRAEGAAALDRLYTSAGRFVDGHDAIRAARKAPPALRPARDALRTARKAGVGANERDVLIFGAVNVIARACEPRWPVFGGPWWTSDTCGLSVDVSPPHDERGRHRFALADALMELDDLPLGVEETDDRRKLDAHRLAIADGALGHAVLAGLAE